VVRLRLGNWRGFRTASARHFPRSRSPLNAFEFALEILKSCQQVFSRCVLRCLAIAELQSLQASVSARHYLAHLSKTFPRFQAEMDCLPFAAGQFDIAIFNAAFHYSCNYERTLRETMRCLRRPGTVIIADSPLYWHEKSGERMLEERQETFGRRFGISADSIQSREYVTPRILDELAGQLEIQWRIGKPWYGVNWALRPAKARLLRRREPSKFYLLWFKVGELR
jgi:hypothetical protein